MSIHPITTPAATTPPTIPIEEDVLTQENSAVTPLSYEERHKKLVETNTRYIFDQMTRSTQHFTQEMIRQAREQQKEDGE